MGVRFGSGRFVSTPPLFSVDFGACRPTRTIGIAVFPAFPHGITSWRSTISTDEAAVMRVSTVDGGLDVPRSRLTLRLLSITLAASITAHSHHVAPLMLSHHLCAACVALCLDHRCVSMLCPLLAGFASAPPSPRLAACPNHPLEVCQSWIVSIVSGLVCCVCGLGLRLPGRYSLHHRVESRWIGSRECQQSPCC